MAKAQSKAGAQEGPGKQQANCLKQKAHLKELKEAKQSQEKCER